MCADTSLYIQWDAYFKKVSHKFVFIKKISYLYFKLIRHSDLRINTKSIRISYMFFIYVYPSHMCMRAHPYPYHTYMRYVTWVGVVTYSYTRRYVSTRPPMGYISVLPSSVNLYFSVFFIILIVMGKVCSKCKVEKDLTEFGKYSASKDGLRYECKPCRKSYYQNMSLIHI